jgi:hypothetical protein
MRLTAMRTCSHRNSQRHQVHEQPRVREACDPQDAGRGAPIRRQDGTAQQHVGVAPTPLQEQERERQAERGEADGRRSMTASPDGDSKV